MVRNQFNQDKTPVLNIVSRIFSVLFLFVSVFFMFRLKTANLLPFKYFALVLVVLAVLNFIFLHIAFKRRTKALSQTILSVIYVLISIILVFSSIKISEIASFISKNFGSSDSTYSIYNVIVNKKSKANNLSDVKGTELFTYEEPVKEISNDDLKTEVKNVIEDSTLVFKEDLDTVMYRPLKLLDTPSIVNNGTFESYISVNEDYESQIKIIGEIKIEVKGDVSDATDAEKDSLANTPFVLFISGIDTRTGTMPSRSLSDVNIIAAINPNAKKILLVAIPRDTYVQLHGTTGLMDKLTHSGSRGGINLTTSTVEDFLGIKIDRYIRVNFNFVTDLVDNIGGITVTNDLNKTLNLDGCTYKPGDNFVDGKCALRFARERKSYSTGDRHRGENQEQVITRILEKVQNDKNLIGDSTKIMNALTGSFNTNLTADDITALVRMQLDDMKSWTIESYNVSGAGKMAKTYSYPNQNLYVMMPDLGTVKTAKQKITSLLLNQ